MLTPILVIGVTFAYLLTLFAVAYIGDKRAEAGRSIIASPWVYALSMAVYCTAWTYFGSVGRAASAGVWFLPIYLGPMLAMILAWVVVRKMIRIAKTYRITSIADFVASRYGKSPLLAGLVTLITVVGIVPYIALQLKAIASGYAVLTLPLGETLHAPSQWWEDSTLYLALALAGFIILFGTRHLDSSERHEGMVAAIAFESVVVENVDERHLRRAVWVFPLYLLLINVFVLPIALGGLLYFGVGTVNPETFVLSLPLSQGVGWLALVAFVGGVSAATGMVIVESIAVSTMVCNDLVMPLLLRTRRFGERSGGDLTGLILGIRRVAIILILLLGYLYFHLAGEAYALVSIGLISFAAVAQFAPAVLGGMYWKGGTRNGALAGLLLGFVLWAYTLMLPSLAKSGWVSTDFLQQGPWGIAWLKPEAFLGLSGLDYLTHSLFWSLFANVTAYVWVSLWQRPAAREASQALLFVDVFQRTSSTHPVFWQGQAKVTDLLHLMGRFLGETRAEQLFAQYAQQVGVHDIGQIPADAKLVHFVETQLTGAIGSASARVMVASVVEEEALELDDVMRMLEEASELRIALEKLKSLDHLKDDFMSSVTHELRTPLTSIRALSEMMQDDPEMEQEQRQQFLGIVVAETERLSRLVNQVLDMAKIEAGHAEWHNSDVDMRDVVQQAVNSVAGTCRERQIALHTELPASVALLRADADRLVQVVLNLLSNALKFVPVSQGEIVVRLLDAPAGVTVTVADNGVGIAPDKHALVFEKFRQVDNEAGSVQGTGLGLPISRQIVEHFGGRMWLESEEGKGACFGFFLPR